MGKDAMKNCRVSFSPDEIDERAQGAIIVEAVK